MDKRTALELTRSLRDRLYRHPQIASKRDLRALDATIVEADEAQTLLDGPHFEEAEDEGRGEEDEG